MHLLLPNSTMYPELSKVETKIRFLLRLGTKRASSSCRLKPLANYKEKLPVPLTSTL
jgi:hypothetical protein